MFHALSPAKARFRLNVAVLRCFHQIHLSSRAEDHPSVSIRERAAHRIGGIPVFFLPPGILRAAAPPVTRPGADQSGWPEASNASRPRRSLPCGPEAPEARGTRPAPVPGRKEIARVWQTLCRLDDQSERGERPGPAQIPACGRDDRARVSSGPARSPGSAVSVPPRRPRRAHRPRWPRPQPPKSVTARCSTSR